MVGLWGITWLRLIIPINRFDPAFPCVPFLEGSREIWCLPHLLSSSIGLLPFFPISTGWSLPPFLLRCLPLPLPPSFGYQGGRLCSALNLAHSIAPPLLTMGTSGAPAVDPDLQPTMHKPRQPRPGGWVGARPLTHDGSSLSRVVAPALLTLLIHRCLPSKEHPLGTVAW